MELKNVLEKLETLKKNATTREGFCADHISGFLMARPQYAEVIDKDLDRKNCLKDFEKSVNAAARKNGGGLGGEAADAVLREFFGLPAKDADANINAERGAAAGTANSGGGLNIDVMALLR